MKIKLNTPLVLSGYKNPISSGHVVESRNDVEAEQLIQMGYVSETDADVTYTEEVAEVADTPVITGHQAEAEFPEISEEKPKGKRGK